jgi:uncharacterized membrane protein YdbT with pleckstrin-like domain
MASRSADGRFKRIKARNMSYVDSNLVPGERVVYRAQLSLWRYWGKLFVGVLFLLATVPVLASRLFTSQDYRGVALGLLAILLLIGAILIIQPFILRRSTELAITDRRVIAKHGLLSTSTLEIRFEKIETVRVNQGLAGRILGYGDVDIRGTGSSFDPIAGISQPQVFKQRLDEAMHPSERPAASQAARST